MQMLELNQVRSVITARTEKVNASWSQSVCLMSDIHFDSPKHDEKLFYKHMRLAEEREALVLIAGDFFDSMQTTHDPRRSPEELMAKYKVSHYLDAIIIDAATYLSQFKVQYILCLGNHETTVLKNNNTNVIDRLAHDINLMGGTAVNAGYSGWIKFLFARGAGGRKSYDLYWHHGSGGSAPVTKGVIQTARQATYINADIVHNGHNHQDYYVPIKQIGINGAGKLETKLMHFVRTPGYKISGIENEDRAGFDVEKVPGVTPRGCAFAEFSYSEGEYNLEVTTKIA